jgi:molybdopterin converting factor subunit 1
LRLQVKLFGALAESAGEQQDGVDVPDEATAADVLDAVGRRHPSARGILDRVSVAVNREVVPAEHRVSSGDEVALLPPVAGGSPRITVGLAERPSVRGALAAVEGPEAGGTVVFVGTVRADGGSVDRLSYSAYREMAEEVLRDIALEASDKWPLEGVAIVHGVGELSVGDVTVVVACSAPHRGDAFEACRYAIDEVKRRAPIWKKERGPEGERWVGLEA